MHHPTSSARTSDLQLPPGIDPHRFRQLVRLASEEDLGARGDISSQVSGLTGQARALLVARRQGVFCGAELLPGLLKLLAPAARIADQRTGAGIAVSAGARLAALDGPAAELLAAERTLLNFLQRLSGVATLTRRFVEAVAGTHAKILDTRKTVPGWRDLDKYAVRCGGGYNHRLGLYDAVLLKDNHLAGVAAERLAHTVFEILNRAAELSPAPDFIEVEVDDLDQLEAVLKVVGVDAVLLDNFPPERIRRAVELRDAAGLKGKLALEASGGISLENVQPIAETGVDHISVGALTHSVPAFDLAVDLAPPRG